MSEIINITPAEQRLQAEANALRDQLYSERGLVKALQSQHDELLHENNLIRARNERLSAELECARGDEAQYCRLFNAACVALGEVSDALGIDADEGGAEPILEEIAQRSKALELERNTVHSLSDQLESVRAAGKLAIDALESGLEAAGEVQNDTHVKYAGYKPELHKHVDDEVAKICAAIEALKAGGAA